MCARRDIINLLIDELNQSALLLGGELATFEVVDYTNSANFVDKMSS
jgi:hypothetical protein